MQGAPWWTMGRDATLPFALSGLSVGRIKRAININRMTKLERSSNVLVINNKYSYSITACRASKS